MPNAKTEFFLTPQGRFCYPYLDTPRTVDLNNKPLDEPKYEVVLYLPKTSADRNQDRTFLALSQKVMEVVGQQFRGQWPQISPRGEWLDWPIDDCDADVQGLEKAPWGRGCWRIRCSGGKYPPKVVDGGNNDLRQFIDINGRFRDGVFKGGDYGIASVNCYGWEYSTVKKGVSFGLEGVKKTADGDPIGGGGRSASEIFGAPTGQPAGYAQPAAPPPALPPGGGYGQPPAPAYAPPAPPVYGGAPPGPPQGGYVPAPGGPAYNTPPVPLNPGGTPPPGYGYAPATPPSNQQGMPPAPPFAGPPIGTR